MIRHFWFLSTRMLNWMLTLQNVKAWAATNCLKLNLSKTKEIVFKRPRVQYFHMPPPLVDIEQLDCCKLLSVIFQSNFKIDSHIQFILSQRLYLLKLLRHQCLPDAQLSVIANAVGLIISRLLYALPTWGGFLFVELVNRINVFSTSVAYWLSSVSYD